ncbi:MAG: hypothetical protein IH991_22205 [Planctomycetes bacterium]|nr:hypothetical protein [Planctomycetota bacterium]
MSARADNGKEPRLGATAGLSSSVHGNTAGQASSGTQEMQMPLATVQRADVLGVADDNLRLLDISGTRVTDLRPLIGRKEDTSITLAKNQ